MEVTNRVARPGGVVAPVNRILPLSTVDGPGARAAIFMQGCNIACAYCHNPETQRLCRHCGACVPVCPAGALEMRQSPAQVVWHREKCTGCDACLAACPHFSSPKTSWMTPAAVLESLAPGLAFIRGITVSGGECTLYPDFLVELFTLAREKGLTCLLDSNGTVDLAALPALMALTDGVMLDVKAWEPPVYRALTGANNNHMVRQNLAWLYKTGKLAEVRLVYLPGQVDAEAAIQGVAQALGAGRKTVPLKLIAFRPHGVRGAAAKASAPAPQEMEALRLAAQNAGFGNVRVV